MSILAQDLINAALLEANVIEPGDNPNGSESNAALLKLNQLASSWDVIRLDASSIAQINCALNVPLTFYDLGGSGAGSFSPRPVALESADYTIVAGSDVLQFPLKIVGAAEFAGAILNGEKARVPRLIYYDANWPTAQIQLYPTLLVTTDSLRLNYWRRSINATGDPFNLGSTIDMPPGYELALRLNLAIALGTTYGRPLDPTLATNAANALAAIRIVNAPGGAGQAAIIQASGVAQPVPPDQALAIPR